MDFFFDVPRTMREWYLEDTGTGIKRHTNTWLTGTWLMCQVGPTWSQPRHEGCSRWFVQGSGWRKSLSLKIQVRPHRTQFREDFANNDDEQMYRFPYQLLMLFLLSIYLSSPLFLKCVLSQEWKVLWWGCVVTDGGHTHSKQTCPITVVQPTRRYHCVSIT